MSSILDYVKNYVYKFRKKFTKCINIAIFGLQKWQAESDSMETVSCKIKIKSFRF